MWTAYQLAQECSKRGWETIFDFQWKELETQQHKRSYFSKLLKMCCPRRDKSFGSVCFPAKFVPCLWIAKVFISLLFLGSLLVSTWCLDTIRAYAAKKKRLQDPTLYHTGQTVSGWFLQLHICCAKRAAGELQTRAQKEAKGLGLLLSPVSTWSSLCCNFKLQFLSVQRSHKDEKCFPLCLMCFLSPWCAVPRCTAVMSCWGLLVWMVWQYSLSSTRCAGFALSTPFAFHCWVDTECG